MFERAKTGEAEAVQAFFDAYAGPLLYVIRARMNRDLRSATDSDDYMQQARIKLLLCDLQAKHFETPQAFLAYMKRIAEREVLQAKRKLRMHQKPLDRLSQAEEEKLVDRAESPSDAEAREER